MTTLTRTYVRPNTTVAFPQITNSAAVRAHITAVYRTASPKLLSTSMSVSPDQLTMTAVSTFANDAAKAEYLADSVLAADIAARNAYCAANGITVSQA
jgi:hypothetical protein